MIFISRYLEIRFQNLIGTERKWCISNNLVVCWKMEENVE